MFFSSRDVDDVLKCAFCSEKFIFAVKMIPDCGYSICGRCYGDIMEREIDEFECKACNSIHMMPAKGFADNQALIRMLKIEPEERVFPEKAQELKALIGETRNQLERINQINRVDEVLAHCGQLRDAVNKSLEVKLAHLQILRDEKLSEIEEYKNELVNGLNEKNPFSRPSKRRRVNQLESRGSSLQGVLSADLELSKVAVDFESFSNKWNECFNKLSKAITDADLDQAHEEVKTFERMIGELETKTKREAFGGHFLEFRDNTTFVTQRDHLGSLWQELPPLESANTSFRAESTFAGLNDSTYLDETASCASQTEQNAEPAIQAVSMEPVMRLVGHSACIYQVLFLPDGKLASCSLDATNIWNPVDGKRLLDLPGAISVAPLANEWLATSHSDGSISVWDLTTRNLVRTLRGHNPKYALFTLRVLPNGNLVSMSWDDTVKVWDAKREQNNLLVSMTGHGIKGDAIDLGMLSNGHLVTCSNGKQSRHSGKVNSVLRVWDPETGVQVKTVSTKAKVATALLVLSDDRVAVGYMNNKIKLVDLNKPDSACTLSTKSKATGRVLAMVQLPNGNLVSCGSRTDTSISIWDIEARVLIKSIETNHSGDVFSLSLSFDGKLLASCSDDCSIKLWSLPSF